MNRKNNLKKQINKKEEIKDDQFDLLKENPYPIFSNGWINPLNEMPYHEQTVDVTVKKWIAEFDCFEYRRLTNITCEPNHDSHHKIWVGVPLDCFVVAWIAIPEFIIEED